MAERRNKLNTFNAELNPICNLPALLGAHHILHVSRVRFKAEGTCTRCIRYVTRLCGQSLPCRPHHQPAQSRLRIHTHLLSGKAEQ